MEQRVKEIINYYLREISLFQDLLKCIIRERDNLINQDIQGIWASLEEKESILSLIEEERRQNGNISGKEINFRDISPEYKDKIRELSNALIRLKLDIKSRVKENVTFINETLSFFDEIISAMATTDADSCSSYGRSGNSKKGVRSPLYLGEV